MKMSCQVIGDLLPLYHDEVCSDESKALVDEHLMECNECKAELEAMDEALPIKTAEQNLNEAIAVQKIAKKWKKGLLESLFKGILITLIVIAVIALFFSFFVEIRFH